MPKNTPHSPWVKDHWHPTRNNSLVLEQLGVKSERKVWWLGDCGHEWEMPLATACKGHGCVYCSGRQVLIGYNDLQTTMPDLAAQWHPSKNTLSIFEISKGSGKQVWWLGECGHEWISSVLNRTKGNGCPVCSGKQVLFGFNDLTTTHPVLAEEWHPTKNALSAKETTKGSRTKVWWLGSCGHEWESTTSNRVHGNGCPVCSNSKVLVGFNDLATTHPIIAAQWYPEQEHNLTPKDVVAGTQTRVSWKCHEGHIWTDTVLNRTQGSNCHICSKHLIVSGINDLFTTHPVLKDQWTYSKNSHLNPMLMSSASRESAWWVCSERHEWKASITSRARGTGCPYCFGRKRVEGVNDFATTHPELLKQWHPTKNSRFNPQTISAHSNHRVWWLGSCGHEWKTPVVKRAIEGRNCPYCSGNKVLAGFNDIATTNPELLAEWHSTKNVVQPTEVSKGYGKVWWQCNKGHEWEAVIYARAAKTVGCPYCVNKKVLPGYNDLLTLNPKVAAEWHPTRNESLIPGEVNAGSEIKVWWQCSQGHEWKTGVIRRTRKNGTGCPNCSSSQPEKDLYDLLISWGLTVEQRNRKILSGKEIDLFLPELNVGIEFNGMYWHMEQHKGVSYHQDKFVAAQKVGVNLIQVWEDDWVLQCEVVEKMLQENLRVVGSVPGEVMFTVLSESQAEMFFQQENLSAFIPGLNYFGYVDGSGDVVLAVAGNADAENNVLRVVAYTYAARWRSLLPALLEEARDALSLSIVEVKVDNCSGDGNLFVQAGYQTGEVSSPQPHFVATTGWRTLVEAGSKGRIWDAGFTNYRM